MVNGRAVKASYQIKQSDIITVKGTRGGSFEVIAIPQGSVPKPEREKYFKPVGSESTI